MNAQIERAPGRAQTDRPRYRALSVGLWIAVAAAIAWAWNVHDPLAYYPRRTDLQVYVGAVHEVVNGGELYEYRTDLGLPFTYPPFALLPFVPLAYLPFTAVKVLAVAWTWASTILIGVLAARHAKVFQPGGPFERIPTQVAAPLIVIALGMSHPVMSNNRFGQISVLLVAIVAFDVLVVCRRWPQYGGILTGLTAAIKLTPLAILPMLWLAGRRRQAYNGLATFTGLGAIGLVIFPGATFDYVLHRAGDMTRFGPYTSTSNQSVNGLLFRAGLDGTTQKALFLVLAGTVLVFAWRRSARLLRSGDPFAALVVIGAAMVAASPISWGHHQVWLWLAALAVVSRTGWRQAAWTLLVVALLSKAPIGELTDGAVPPIDWLVGSMRCFLAIAIATVVPFQSQARAPREGLAPARGH